VTLPVILNKQISNRELSILRFLYRVRGATNLQIVRGLGLKNTVTSEKNMFKPLNKLIKENLLDYQFVKPSDRKFFFLSEEGFEFMKRYLDVKPFHKGSGYGDDFGDFPYKLQKPPAIQAKHYLLQVDSIIEIEAVKKLELLLSGHFKVDWRDNRYISTRFDLKITDKKVIHGELKPDMELTISLYNEEGVLKDTYYYLIEVDTGTERKVKLLNKLESYKLYFEYLQTENRNLPKGILFVGDKKEHQFGLDSRWASLTEVFGETLASYGMKVNLYYETMDNLQNMIKREISFSSETPKVLQEISKHVLSNPSFSGNSMFYFTKKTAGYDGFMPSTIAEASNGSRIMYCYVRVDGYETLGWYELRNFLKFFETERTLNERYGRIKKIIPVVYYFNKPGPMLHPDFFKHSPHLQLNEMIYFDCSNKCWYTTNMEKANGLPLPR